MAAGASGLRESAGYPIGHTQGFAAHLFSALAVFRFDIRFIQLKIGLSLGWSTLLNGAKGGECVQSVFLCIVTFRRI